MDPANRSASRYNRQLKPARVPPPHLLHFTDTNYNPYDLNRQNVGQPVAAFKTWHNYSDFDSWSLWKWSLIMQLQHQGLNVYQILALMPKHGVLYDDRSLAYLIDHIPRNMLRVFLGDIDHNGMVRALRIPKGHAYKRFFRAGTLDMFGQQVPQDGWYYMWYRGIHCLMGKEGFDANQHLVRTSGEQEYPNTWYFRVSHRAEVQMQPGDPNDPTFQ